MQKHKDADREIISRDNNLRDSHSVAYRYYALINDITLPAVTEKGTEKGQYISERFELRDPKYSYRHFETWNFAAPVGADSELNVVSGTKFEYCIFDNCIFENIIFRDCCFFRSFTAHTVTLFWIWQSVNSPLFSSAAICRG